jgi:hypothetical protein
MSIWQDVGEIIGDTFAALSDDTVTYSRGASTLIGLSATFGHSEFPATSTDGSVITWTSEDVIVNTADLILNGAATKPVKGDRIIRVLPDGSTVHYEVHQPGPSAKAYTLSCEDIRLRIHCKRVAS